MLVLSTVPLPVAAADSEPDTIGAARSISVGSTVSGTVESGGDDDWFKFTVQRAKEVRVEFTVPSAANGGSRLGTTLYDPDERSIDGGRADPAETAIRGATTVKSGTYYFRVSDYFGSSGPYSFRVVVSDIDQFELNQVRADATAITVGQEVSAAVSFLDDDWYSFQVDRAKEVRVEFTVPSAGSGGSRLGTTLYDPDERSIDGGRADPAETAIRGATTVKSGTYYFRVSDYFRTTGPYSFTVSVSDTDDFEPNQVRADAVALTPGVPQDGEITFLDDDWFSVPVERGQIVRVAVDIPSEASGGSRLGTTLYAPNEQSVAGGRVDPGETSIIGDTAEFDGMYYVLIRDYFRTTGPYTLNVSVLDDDAFEPNERGVDAFGLFENPRTPDEAAITVGDQDWFEYDVGAGESVEFTLTIPSDGARLVPSIYAPGASSATVSGRTDAGTSETLSYTTTTAGLHRFAVGPYFGTRSAYSFSLTVDGETVGLPNDRFERNENRNGAAAIAPGLYEDLAMVDDDEDWFAFEADRGDRVVAAIRFAHADNDLTLELRNPNGNVVSTGDSATDGETVDFVAAQSGTHYLRVTGEADKQAIYSLQLAIVGGVNLAVGPGSANVAPGDSATFDVVLSGVAAGVGPFDFTLESSDTSLVTITGATVTQVSGSVSVAGDGSSVTVSTSANQSRSGSVVIARVTVAAAASAEGSTTVDFSGTPTFATTLGSGVGYPLAQVQGTDVRVSTGPSAIGARYGTPNDFDGDGRYEDVNGDGTFNVIDVSVLLSEFDRPGVQDQAQFFDFNGDGTVNIIDVADLLDRT